MIFSNVNRLPHKFLHILMKINKFCFWFILTTFYLLRLFLFSYLHNIFQFQQLFFFICLSQNGHINSSNSFFIITCDIFKNNVTVPYFRENSRFHKNSHGVTSPHTISFTWRYHPLSTSIWQVDSRWNVRVHFKKMVLYRHLLYYYRFEVI